MASAIHREPSMDSAVSNSQRGRDEPVSVCGDRCILAQFQRQFGEHGTLDFVNILVLCCRDSRACRDIIAISMVRLRWYRLASEPRFIHAHVPMPLAALDASAARTRTIATCLRSECVLLHGPRLRGRPSPTTIGSCRAACGSK